MAEMQEKPDACIEELEKAYDRHKETAEKSKHEYDKIHEQLIGRLSIAHLEPFAKTLLERESIVLDTETAIGSIQKRLRERICDPWNDAWKEHIGANVAKLEMLKEHFKEFEGSDWKLHENNVEGRTLPLRMEFKLKKLHWLQKQVEQQSHYIKKKTEEIVQQRLLVHQMSNDFAKLTEHVKNTDTESKKQELKKMFNDDLQLVLDKNSTDEKNGSD